MMKDDELRAICRRLKPIIGKKADMLWLGYAISENSFARQESEALIQMFAARHLSQQANDSEILLPPENKEAAEGEIFLGTIVYKGKDWCPVRIDRNSLSRHMGFFGITGSGKTVCVQNLLLELLRLKTPWLCIDWKRSYRDLLSHKNPDVRKIQVFTIGRKSENMLNWNPLRPPPGIDIRTWISVVADTLERSHISGAGSGLIFSEIVDAQFEKLGWFEGKGERYPNFFDAFRDLENKRFTGRKGLWADSCMRILHSFVYGPASSALNSRNPVHIEDLLNGFVVLELDMEIPKQIRVFIGECLLRYIHLVRLRQGDTSALRHLLVLEEIHNLLPRSERENQAGNSLETCVRELRSMGQGICAITQHPSLVPIFLLGNVGTLVSLSLQHEEDVWAMKKALFLNPGEEVFLDRLQVGHGIVKIKNRLNPCLVRFPFIDLKKRGDIDGEASLDS